MKPSTLLLCVVALAVWWFALSKPAATPKAAAAAMASVVHRPANPNGPRMAMVGQVEQRLSEGIIVSCRRPPRPIASGLASIGGGGGVFIPPGNQSEVFGRFLLRNHPTEAQLADGDRVDVQAVEDGLYQSQGETLHAYWCTGASTEQRPVATPARWRSALDEKARSTR